MGERTKKLLKKAPVTTNKIVSSFRDPSGFVFNQNGVVYRQINSNYKEDYKKFVDSGLYKKLSTEGLIVKHTEETGSDLFQTKDGFKVIRPTQIPFISYPYEWTFAMLKDAALLTLQIQKIALEYGMSLKDASAFNIQFLKGKPLLIDTLSFETYEEGKPWVAYKQFVEHFLCPLSLASMVDIQLIRMFSVFLDGIPVDLASSMLPFSSRLNLNLLVHIHAHASSKKRFSKKKIGSEYTSRNFGKRSLLGLIDSLEGAVSKCNWESRDTQWGEYYEEDNNNYTKESMPHKQKLVGDYLKEVKAKSVWDMGANMGNFSKIAAEMGAEVISFDYDYGALERNYKELVKADGQEKILPLFCDLTNPTPSTGWVNQERHSLFERGPADAVLALALIHHLAIPHNIPFVYLAQCFSKMGKYLVIEYIDKQDSQVQILLANRKDIFTNYTQEDFEKAFKQFFSIKRSVPIKGSKRVLYLMEKIGNE